jgi:ribosome biogenesis GTPase
VHITLEQLGWDATFAGQLTALGDHDLVPGRVSRYDGGAVTVLTAAGPVRATLAGRLRYAGEDVAVGDWVALRSTQIHAVLPRRSTFSRLAVGGETVTQIVASNVDTVFVVTPLTGEVKLRWLERYLTVAWQSGANPVVVLTKADLHPAPEQAVADASAVAYGVPVHAVSGTTGDGLAALGPYLVPGRTVAMVGASGVGKSTLANELSGGTAGLATAAVRDSDGRGRHTTTYRQLVVLPSGALLIDTPGMRELALADADEGVDTAFADIAELADGCRFHDCAHDAEPGCAVQSAIAAGDLDPDRLTSWRKLQREQHRLAIRQDKRARAQEHAKLKAEFKARRTMPYR